MAEKDKGITAKQLEAVIQKAVFQALEQSSVASGGAREASPLEQHLASILTNGDRIYAEMQAALEKVVRAELERLGGELAERSRQANDAIPNEIVQQLRNSGFWPRLDTLTEEQAKLEERLQGVEKKVGRGRKGKQEDATMEDISRLGSRISEVDNKVEKLNRRVQSAPGVSVDGVAQPAAQPGPVTITSHSDQERFEQVRKDGLRTFLLTFGFLAIILLLAFGVNLIGRMTPSIKPPVDTVQQAGLDADQKIPDKTLSKPAVSCPPKSDVPLLTQEPAWQTHFEGIHPPDVVRAAFGIDDLTFKDEVIRLAKLLENHKQTLAQAPPDQDYATIEYTDDFRFGTGGEIKVRVAYTGSDSKRNFYDWVNEAYKGETAAKPNAKNISNLWLYLVSESSERQRSLNKPDRSKAAFLEKLQSRLQLNRCSSLAGLLEGEQVDPLDGQTIALLQSVFKQMDPERYRQQINGLAGALRQRRQDEDFIPLGDVIAEQNIRLYAVMCREGQPTPLETWYRTNQVAAPLVLDKSILVLWLSAKFGQWQCDGDPAAVIALLRKLGTNAGDPFGTLNWSN